MRSQYGSSMELSCTVDKSIEQEDRVVAVCLGLVEGEWSAWAEGMETVRRVPVTRSSGLRRGEHVGGGRLNHGRHGRHVPVAGG